MALKGQYILVGDTMANITANDVIDAMARALEYIASSVPEYYPFSYFLKTTPIVYKKDIIAATDGKRIYVGDMFLKFGFEEQLFVVIHELWHIIARDAFRAKGKNNTLWNIAADLKNNQFIREQKLKGVKLIQGVLIDSRYNSYTRETIYDMMYEMCENYGYVEVMGKKVPCFGGGGGGGQGEGEESEGQGQGESEEERENKEEEGEYTRQVRPSKKRGRPGKIEQGKEQGKGETPLTDYPLSKDVFENDNVADEEDVNKRIERSIKEYEEKSQGKGLSDELRKYVDINYTPKLPWQSIVQMYFQRIAATDYTWRNPKILYNVGPNQEYTYLPRLRQKAIRIGIAIDTSGSINDKEAIMFLKEMTRLMNTIFFGGSASGALLLTTENVYEAIKIPPIPLITNVQKQLKSGGTSFVPAFEWVKTNFRDDIDLFIYFTDGYGDYPKTAPRYPVIWIITTDLNKLKDDKYYPPFGKVVQL